MKNVVISVAAAAAASLATAATAFAPTRPMLQTRTTTRSTALNGALSASLPSLPSNPYKNLPWKLERIEQRAIRRQTLENATLFRELGLREDATYEDVRDKTATLVELAGDDIKARIKVEIARDKIYSIRLNERYLGKPDISTIDAQRASLFDAKDFMSMTDTLDDVLEKKKKDPVKERKIFFISWLLSCIKAPDDAYKKRQLIIWGGASVVCLINPPLCEGAMKIQWLAAGGQMGYRGMPPRESGGGYSPLRGRRNKMHQIQAMGIAVVVWIAARSFANWAVNGTPALAASRSSLWFKFAIVNVAMAFSTAYTQTYKGDTKDLMI